MTYDFRPALHGSTSCIEDVTLQNIRSLQARSKMYNSFPGGIKIIQTAFFPSNANAARSINALNALICLRTPPSSLALLASDAICFNLSSIFVFPSFVVSEEDFPRSTASSIS